MASVRVRFAPSPTGYLHVGGARTALFNWLYARKTGGVFVLRIEDTDKERSTEAHTQVILDGLEWLGVTCDEGAVLPGPGERGPHRADAQRLLEAGTAPTGASVTREELDASRQAAEHGGAGFRYDGRCGRLAPADIARTLDAGTPFSLRLRMPDEEIAWEDAVHGRISFQGRDLDDFIILRSDGTPIYNLAVVSDDIDMRITLVMRGDDHISNTPKQILLYRALGVTVPQFAHVPMILGSDGKKLSKRHGATAVGDYQYLGLLPGAMLNFLALLGWSTGDDTEVMTLPQLIEKFDVHGLQKKAAVFDTKKLEWMNGQHLALISLDELAPIVAPALAKAGYTTTEALDARRDWYFGLLDLLRIRSRVIDDIVRQAAPYFLETIEYDPEAVGKQWRDAAAAREILSATRERLAELPVWEPGAMEEALRKLAEELGISGGKIFQPLRVALVGLTVSPGIFEVLQYIGRDRSLARLDAAVEYLRG